MSPAARGAFTTLFETDSAREDGFQLRNISHQSSVAALASRSDITTGSLPAATPRLAGYAASSASTSWDIVMA